MAFMQTTSAVFIAEPWITLLVWLAAFTAGWMVAEIIRKRK